MSVYKCACIHLNICEAHTTLGSGMWLLLNDAVRKSSFVSVLFIPHILVYGLLNYFTGFVVGLEFA